MFYPPKGLLLLSPLPLAFVAQMCYQPLTSPANLQNCAPTPFLKSKNLRQGSGEAFTKRRSQKRQHLEKRKRDQDVIIPRNVSTFVAGEKRQPPLSDSVFIAYIRPVNVRPQRNTRIFITLKPEVSKRATGSRQHVHLHSPKNRTRCYCSGTFPSGRPLPSWPLVVER